MGLYHAGFCPAAGDPARSGITTAVAGALIVAGLNNLFDEDYITALTIQTGNSGLILGQPSDPRLVGVTV